MFVSSGNLQGAIETLSGMLGSAPAQLASLSDVQASARPDTGGWSRQEILGHLIDSAANNHHRFVRAQFESDFAMPGYVQDSWVESNRYAGRAWSDLIDFWTLYNRHLLHLMRHMPQDCFSRMCRIGDGEPVTLEFLMVDYVGHLGHHLKQILGESVSFGRGSESAAVN